MPDGAGAVGEQVRHHVDGRGTHRRAQVGGGDATLEQREVVGQDMRARGHLGQTGLARARPRGQHGVLHEQERDLVAVPGQVPRQTVELGRRARRPRAARLDQQVARHPVLLAARRRADRVLIS
jgi:hypothetical protein